MSGGGRRSEDAGEVPWPALVDLLTSVLITFMFFILVTTVAMSAMTIKQQQEKTKQREEEKPVSPTEVTTPSTATMPSNTLLPPPTRANTVESEDPISAQENDRLKAENELLKQQLASMGASFAKSKEIKTVAEPNDDALTLLFNPNEAGMTDPVKVSVAKFIAEAKAKFGPNAQYLITGSEPEGVSFSQARERALTRAMVVRNALLESNVTADTVNFQYDAGERFKSHNWVRIQALHAGASN